MLYEHLTPTQAVAVFGVSRQWIYQLLARYKAVGLQALEPISRRPHSNPRCLSNGLLQEIITLRRELLLQDLVTPQSKKRPKAYIQSFKAVQPNETWQFDFTHLRPCDGSDVEIIYWLDDHSRLLLSCSVYKAITGKIKRFHQSLKKWLSQQSPAKDLKELQC